MIKLNSPTETVEMLADLRPSQSDVIAVLTYESFDLEQGYGEEVFAIEKLNPNALHMWYDNLCNMNAESFILIAGVDVDTTVFRELVDIARKNEEHNASLLDSLLVDWEERHYVSTICDNNECCNPANPKRF